MGRSLEIGGGNSPIAHQSFEQFDMHPWEELQGYAAFHQGDARDLSRFDDNTFDEVLSSQTLEHFSWRETGVVVREWVRVIKPGGLLTLLLPDIRGMLFELEATKNWAHFVKRLYGEQDYDGNAHYTMFNMLYFPTQISEIFKDNIEQVRIVDLHSFSSSGGIKAVLRKAV